MDTSRSLRPRLLGCTTSIVVHTVAIALAIAMGHRGSAIARHDRATAASPEDATQYIAAFVYYWPERRAAVPRHKDKPQPIGRTEAAPEKVAHKWPEPSTLTGESAPTLESDGGRPSTAAPESGGRAAYSGRLNVPAGLGDSRLEVRSGGRRGVGLGGLDNSTTPGNGPGKKQPVSPPAFAFGTPSSAGPRTTPAHIHEPVPVAEYPAEARAIRREGVVVLEVLLGANGTPRVRAILSAPLGYGIEQAASLAALRLRFTPAQQDGRAVDSIVRITVSFTLA